MLPILLSLALLGYGVSVAENPYTSEGLSVEELVELLKEVGFPKEEIPEAVRVVALESKGVPGALQEEADDPAIGLFQVDLKPHWDLNPKDNQMRKWFMERGIDTREKAVEYLKDPKNNATAALEIWRLRKKRQDSPSGWEAWSVYNDGKIPEGREEEDFKKATTMMQTAMELLKEKVVKVQDTGVSTPINMKISETGRQEYESQVPKEAGSFESAQIKTNIGRTNVMTERKRKLNDIFIKLFAELRGDNIG